MKKFASALLVSLGVLTTPIASCSEIITMEFIGANVTGKVSLEVELQSNGVYSAVSGSGFQQFESSSEPLGLVPNQLGLDVNASPGGAFYFDNLIFLSGMDYLSEYGLLFNTANQEINVYGLGEGKYRYHQQNGFWEDVEIMFAIAYQPPAEVPEPPAVLMFAAGLLAVVGARRRTYLQ